MLLALDVGNTNVHCGVYRGEELLAHVDFFNSRERSCDELGLLLRQLLDARGVGAPQVQAVAVASVVPSVTDTVVAAVRQWFNLEPFVLGPSSDLGIAVRYGDLRELGADRIADAVGGFVKYGGPLIVVDAGTATTVDAIAADGTYLGGAIAPGLRICMDALSQRAPRLPRVELNRPAAAIGTSTGACLQSGIIFGYAGLVEALVERIRREIGGSPAVVATGGLAGLIARETGVVRVVDQHLTLDGLRLIFARQRPRR